MEPILSDFQDALLIQRVAVRVAAAPKWDKLKTKRWMVNHVEDHVDRKTDEVNSTSLAEEAAQEFNIYENTRDYKIPDDLFDLSADVAEQWEKSNKKAAKSNPESAPKKKRTKGKKRPPVTPREVVNISQTEERALQYLKDNLYYALGNLETNRKEVEERKEQQERDRKQDLAESKRSGVPPLVTDEQFKKKMEELEYPDGSLVDDMYNFIYKGLDHLATILESNEWVTREGDLTQAVKGFAKLFYTDKPVRKEPKALSEATGALYRAHAAVPTSLSSPSTLGKLRECFELLAEATNTVSMNNLKAPKIPNALDAEDPRQLGFGFAARHYVRLAMNPERVVRHYVRLAMRKYATINDLSTLEGLLEMEVASFDGDSKNVSLSPEIKSSARAYDAAVEKVLRDWASDNLNKLELDSGPLQGCTDADDVVRVLSELRGGAGYLYYMEADGAGVGTWDGDWDPCFKEEKTLHELSKIVKNKTHAAFQKLKSSFEDRAMELAEPE